MSIFKYVSADWNDPGIPGMPPTIKAIGDDGLEYFVPSIETDVAPWPAFLETEEGQAFAKTTPPQAAVP